MMSSYAQALYSLAVDDHCEDEIYSQISAVKFAFEDNPELSKILDRPCGNKSELAEFIDKCFKDVNIYLLNCIKVMSKRRVTAHFSEMAAEFMKLHRKSVGIEKVDVIVAVPLSEDRKQRLISKLGDKLNKTIELTVKVDPQLIGGIVVRTESSQIDSSIKTRLSDIENQIKSAVV